jgi:hypothetical protein
VAESVVSAQLYFNARRRFRAVNVPVLQCQKKRVHPIYRNYPYNIHVDNGVPVLPNCFNERNVLQIGTQAYPFYSTRIRRVYPAYRNYPYSIHVDDGVPVLPDCQIKVHSFYRAHLAEVILGTNNGIYCASR